MFTIYFAASRYIPTYAKRRQYIAAIIGPGMDAKTAPNFPTKTAQNHYLDTVDYCQKCRRTVMNCLSVFVQITNLNNSRIQVITT